MLDAEAGEGKRQGYTTVQEAMAACSAAVQHYQRNARTLCNSMRAAYFVSPFVRFRAGSPPEHQLRKRVAHERAHAPMLGLTCTPAVLSNTPITPDLPMAPQLLNSSLSDDQRGNRDMPTPTGQNNPRLQKQGTSVVDMMCYAATCVHVTGCTAQFQPGRAPCWPTGRLAAHSQ